MQVFIDIDNFKLVNDRFGHQIGDRLICQIAERLGSLSDKADVLARVSGDEFTLLYGLTSEADIPALAAPLATAFESPFGFDGNSIFLTASMGISVFPLDARTAGELWLNSDLAMYEAKASGRNRQVQFSSRIRDRRSHEAQVAQTVRRALHEREFVLALQPKVLLSSADRVIGAEVLIRCTSAELSGISPAEFMPIAERAGLIRHIDLLVIDLVGAFMAGLRSKGRALRVSVNLSPDSLRQLGFGAMLLDAMTEARLTSSDVLFELTEGAIMDTSANVRANVDLLLAHGFEFSADDFGTGYSSLAYLQNLRLKELKIDRSFVSRLGQKEGASDPIVLAILSMAKALDLRTVAEGIETRKQADWLRDHGCTIGQGYLFGKGMAPEDFVETFLTTGP